MQKWQQLIPKQSLPELRGSGTPLAQEVSVRERRFQVGGYASRDTPLWGPPNSIVWRMSQAVWHVKTIWGGVLGDAWGDTPLLGRRTPIFGEFLSQFGSVRPFGGHLRGSLAVFGGRCEGAHRAKRDLGAAERRCLERVSGTLAFLRQMGTMFGGCLGRNPMFGQPNLDF